MSSPGPVALLCYNAGTGHWGDIDETTVDTMAAAWRLNVAGLLTCSQQVVPDLRPAARGNIVVTGATASLRGGAGFTSFAAAKAAQHSLAQSMARSLGADGIHVCILIVDGVVDTPTTRKMLPDRPDGFFLVPDDIAESALQLTRQPASAWTFQLDLRPAGENW